MTSGQDDQKEAAVATMGGVYNGEDLGKKLADLDALIGQVEQPLHKDRFEKVQDFLKKNNGLIQDIVARQKEATQAQGEQGGGGGGSEGQKKALQQCAEMIKELNDNLTQVYDIYAELQPTAKESD